MTTVRLRRKLESETLHLPELKPLIGKTVQIIVVEEPATPASGQRLTKSTTDNTDNTDKDRHKNKVTGTGAYHGLVGVNGRAVVRDSSFFPSLLSV